MTMAGALLRETFRRLFANPGAAIRVSWLPYTLLMLLGWGWFTPFREMLGALGGPGAGMGYGIGWLWPVLLYTLLSLILVGWVAVPWHRFLLLGESPPVVPLPRPGRVLRYALKTLVLFILIGVPAALAGAFLVWLAVHVFATAPPGPMVLMTPAGLLMAFFVYFLVLALFLSLGQVLPALAIGRPLGLGEAWARAKRHRGAILFLALIATPFALFADFHYLRLALTLPEGMPAGALSFVIEYVVGWLALMLLTTMVTVIYARGAEAPAA